jgi:predicted lipoprotein with Yx(FWY)xxD motif
MRTTSMRRGTLAPALRAPALLALALLVLAGCGSSSYGGGSTAAGSSSPAAASNADLKTADTGLGKVVVDRDGRTVYVFDKDTAGAGTSACTGDCLAKWPPVQATSGELTVSGVTGQLGTITRDDGTEQVTLAGMPLYLYSGDSHAGDVTGQAVGGVWWAVSPAGSKITAAAAASSSSAAPPGTGY